MKTVILCGGYGTRLSEETEIKPKPMVEIGDKPILWHIIKIYLYFGYNDFILACGYKSEVIKSFFVNYQYMTSDVTVHVGSAKIEYSNNSKEKFKIAMVETGKKSMTGGRLHRLEKMLNFDKTFMLTYGDGVADVNISKLVQFHQSHGKLATVTAVRPPARFGRMVFNKNQVIDFKEKPQMKEGWINGGFFVFEPGVFDYLHGDETVLEAEPLEKLSRDGELMAYKHNGFWQCMDTLRDKNTLEEMWQKNKAPWKIW